MEVTLIEYMGSDLSVVNAAKQSFGKESKELTNKDIRLINFLARGYTQDDWDELVRWFMDDYRDDWHDQTEQKLLEFKRHAQHWGPFAHPHISLKMSAPVPIARQIYKHKIGFVESEESRRYISSRPELFIPEYFRKKPDGNIKQGSGDKHPDSDYWLSLYRVHCEEVLDTYEEMISKGVCPEQARFFLPQGVEVNWIWTGSLAAYARFYNQRSDSHAQKEVQDLAEEVSKIIKPLFPYSWSALTE